uniref:Uncharacterized protein n=1 Tax=Setaria viridis TaxID=4556 RepID=A0A4U6TIE5_SETVI|nr:hypothetical protein SEVIR_8G180866v2 [Setaria viridis]
MAPARYRGAFSNGFQLTLCLGSLAANVTNYGADQIAGTPAAGAGGCRWAWPASSPRSLRSAPSSCRRRRTASCSRARTVAR